MLPRSISMFSATKKSRPVWATPVPQKRHDRPGWDLFATQGGKIAVAEFQERPPSRSRKCLQFNTLEPRQNLEASALPLSAQYGHSNPRKTFTDRPFIRPRLLYPRRVRR